MRACTFPEDRRRRAAAAAIGVVTAVGAVLLGAAPALAAPAQVGAVELSAPETGEVGDVIEVAVAATDAADVYAAQFELGYDDEALRYVTDSAAFLDGGYGTVSEETGAAQLAYTRLGSSPGISGDVTVVTVSFEVLRAGEATVSIDDGALIGTEGEQGPFGAVDPVTISVADDADADPTNPDESDDSGDDQAATDGADGTNDPTTTDGSGDTAADGGEGDGELAVTGGTIVGAGFVVVLAAGAIVAGIVMVRRRREGLG
ncbi:cohesin domain-containing protein [Microbacterium halotolerans]|uniref:cohesin domain-containing protein n=1 Tax=Microbacterium halotolerans TaxID=246613 RepID=UPI0013C35471|nr:cohesin domain-containing protein [Microbacterium halotolerans]